MFEKIFEQIFAIAKKKDIKKIEIILQKSTDFFVKVFQQAVEQFSSSETAGLGIRIIDGKKVGYAYTEKFDIESFKTILDKARENAGAIEDEELTELENYPEIEKKLKIYYPQLQEIKVENKISKAMKLESDVRDFDQRILLVTHALVGDNSSFIKIANSEGLNKEYISNGVYSFANCLAKDKNMNKSGNYFDVSHKFAEIKPEYISRKAATNALELLGAKEIKSGKYPTIFKYSSAATMLGTFSNIFSAKAVQEGQSLLKGKLNKRIADAKVSIVDDALYEKGFATRPFDDEGYPSQKTELIKNGVLKSFIHNSITARKDKTVSTGNASRKYKGTLGVSPSNLFIENGEKSKDELYKAFPKSIEIVSLAGMHSGCNPISGDFSLSAEGFMCDNQGRKYPIHNFTISGNFFQLLNDIVAIADNLKLNMHNIGSPAFLVKELNISG